jgi:hypothetical protein
MKEKNEIDNDSMKATTGNNPDVTAFSDPDQEPTAPTPANMGMYAENLDDYGESINNSDISPRVNKRPRKK